MSVTGYGCIAGDMLATRARENKSIDINKKWKLRRVNEITGFTVLTAATAAAIMSDKDYLQSFNEFSEIYRSYSGSHIDAKRSYSQYREFAVTYISPVSWISGDIEKVVEEARRYAESLQCTPDVIGDCMCAAGTLFMARTGYDKEAISQYVTMFYQPTSDAFTNSATFERKTLKSSGVLQTAVRALLHSQDVESALHLAVSTGNGAVAVLAGSLADSFYGLMDSDLWGLCHNSLDDALDQIFDSFFNQYIIGENSRETKRGSKILPEDFPQEWRNWPLCIDLGFTFTDTFGWSSPLHDEYSKPTFIRCAEKLFRREKDDWVFPSYGVLAVGITPALEWYASWPLQRRGSMDKLIRMDKMGGAEGWGHSYNTLIRLYLLPTFYSSQSWCYVNSRGRLMLDVGGRTKEQAIENWYRVAKSLRRVLKRVRAESLMKESHTG